VTNGTTGCKGSDHGSPGGYGMRPITNRNATDGDVPVFRVANEPDVTFPGRFP
jgi:hypothetical protein